MNKLKQFLRVNYKFVLGTIFGMILMGTGVYATTVAGGNVSYDNTSSGLISTNVQSAIDELYAKSNTLKSTVELYRNSNIVKVMKYDQTENSSTLCITGNEVTCEELAPITSTTYDMGTIVDYRVNPSTVRRFYVLHDDGATLTLQDQKNIVDNVEYATKADFIADGGTELEWNSCPYVSGERTRYGCNNRGPVTVLPALENATDTWTNVNLQAYTPGVTSFLGNNKTGCTSTECTSDTYSMSKRSGRSRLITVPEAWRTGCITWSVVTCPKYMYNYLKEANNYGGVVSNSNSSWGYWALNVRTDDVVLSFLIYADGSAGGDFVASNSYGARAIVEINK